MKLPAFQFYPADWRKDPAVQALSYHDRGIWFEILCLMHESEQRGKLTLNGKPMPEDALARLLGLDKQLVTKAIYTLLEYGVASRSSDGILMNRRMVRDEEIRKIRADCGKMGGHPLLVKQNESKTQPNAKQKPTPSSSVSSSASTSVKGLGPPNPLDLKFSKQKNSAKKPVFIPPTEKEVQDYFTELQENSWDKILIELQSKKFFHHYNGIGWLKNNKKISDWRSVVQGWIMNQKDFDNERNSNTPKSKPISGRITEQGARAFLADTSGFNQPG